MKKKFKFTVEVEADNFQEACNIIVQNMIDADNGINLHLLDKHGDFVGILGLGIQVKNIQNVSKPIITPTPDPVRRT